MRFLILASLILISPNAFTSELSHEPARRLVVFPFATDHQQTSVAEEVWWDLREKLSETRRFLLASRNFMESKNALQARRRLSPADAIVLGRLLDAQALMVTFVEERNLHMIVYSGINGSTLWKKQVELHPSMPISSLLPESVKRLAFDFVASIPYQGFVIVDSLIGRAYYRESGRDLIQVEISADAQISVGDSVQVVDVRARSLEPLFQEGLSIEVLAEGEVIRVERSKVVVQVNRKKEGYEPKENHLVRFPTELKRLQEVYQIQDGLTQNIDIDFVRGEMEVLTEEQKANRPLVTALSFIANIALILLIAF